MSDLCAGDNGDELTKEEAAAIAALRRLDARWPSSLTLASMGGSLVVFHTGDPRWGAFAGVDRAEAVLAEHFSGIPNDGGDW